RPPGGQGLRGGPRVGEVRSRCGPLGPRHVGNVGGVGRKVGSALARSKLVEGAVGGDAKQPRAEREALERGDGPPGGEERVLNDVLGVGCRPDDAQSVPIKRSLLSSREILEGARVPRSCALDEKLDLAVRRPGQSALVARDGLKSLASPVEEKKKKVVVIGEDDEPIAVLLRDAISDDPAYQA